MCGAPPPHSTFDLQCGRTWHGSPPSHCRFPSFPFPFASPRHSPSPYTPPPSLTHPFILTSSSSLYRHSFLSTPILHKQSCGEAAVAVTTRSAQTRLPGSSPQSQMVSGATCPRPVRTAPNDGWMGIHGSRLSPKRVLPHLTPRAVTCARDTASILFRRPLHCMSMPRAHYRLHRVSVS